MLNRFHSSKTSHPTTGDDVCLIAVKASMTAHLVSVNEEDPKWSFDRKVIVEFRRGTPAWIRECTAGTSMAHLLDV